MLRQSGNPSRTALLSQMKLPWQPYMHLTAWKEWLLWRGNINKTTCFCPVRKKIECHSPTNSNTMLETRSLCHSRYIVPVIKDDFTSQSLFTYFHDWKFCFCSCVFSFLDPKSKVSSPLFLATCNASPRSMYFLCPPHFNLSSLCIHNLGSCSLCHSQVNIQCNDC